MENFRVRKVIILFYLEDNSCQVVEPKEDNSGLPQVCIHTQSCLQSLCCLLHLIRDLCYA